MANGQRKSSALKLLNNNAGNHKDLNSDTVDADALNRKPPSSLSKKARIIWKETLERIKQSNVHNNLDYSYFERYCQIKAQSLECAAHIEEHGPEVEEVSYNQYGANIKKKESVQSKNFKSFQHLLNAMEGALGLSPLGRRRLGVESAKDVEEDLLKSFLDRKDKKA